MYAAEYLFHRLFRKPVTFAPQLSSVAGGEGPGVLRTAGPACPSLRGLPRDLQVGGLVRVVNPCQGFKWGKNFPLPRRTSRNQLEPMLDFEIPKSLEALRGV